MVTIIIDSDADNSNNMYFSLQYISPNVIQKLCKHFITPVLRGITWLENQKQCIWAKLRIAKNKLLWRNEHEWMVILFTSTIQGSRQPHLRTEHMLEQELDTKIRQKWSDGS